MRTQTDLLVLIRCDSGEDGLREAEGLDPLPGGDGLVGGQLAAEVLPDDVNARLILVHGVEDDLDTTEELKSDTDIGGSTLKRCTYLGF